MNAAIRNSRVQYAQVQQQAEAAAAQFRSNSRFFVQQGENNSWAIVGADDNRLYGQRRRYFDAVTYAESLERAVNAKSVPVLKVSPPDDVRTRWAALWALVLIVMAGAFSS
ncbi:hypothetical protein RDI61_01815 [Pseudomonas plecoglossicida]|uniref:hypothetical protein n=1 Tax=Pseudomonas putida group TaxID=136845 RepID=UPI002410229C|nr:MULTISPECIES: hypothetical protein [Pseudomonas putida group]MDQ7962789.1 hypothetical protein [Pseudomonas plecoglossicida]WFG05213.1 hypothetical protein P3X84_11495 [Pseudomonas putida]